MAPPGRPAPTRGAETRQGRPWLSPPSLPAPGTPQVPHRLPLLPAGFSFPDQDVAPQHLRGEPAPPRSVRGRRGAPCGLTGARVGGDPSSLSLDRRGMCASPFSTRRSTTPRAGSCPRSGGTPPRTSGEGSAGRPLCPGFADPLQPWGQSWGRGGHLCHPRSRRPQRALAGLCRDGPPVLPPPSAVPDCGPWGLASLNPR